MSFISYLKQLLILQHKLALRRHYVLLTKLQLVVRQGRNRGWEEKACRLDFNTPYCLHLDAILKVYSPI